MRVLSASMLGVSLLVYTGASAEMRQPAPLPDSTALAPMALNGYSRFPHNIGSAPVFDLDGHRVGLVQKLDADPTGKPAGMEIWFPTGRSLAVAASNISYDEQQNTLTAGLSDAQLADAKLVAPPGTP